MITGIELIFRKPLIAFNRVSVIGIVRDNFFVMVSRFMRETMFFKLYIVFPTVCIKYAAKTIDSAFEMNDNLLICSQ